MPFTSTPIPTWPREPSLASCIGYALDMTCCCGTSPHSHITCQTHTWLVLQHLRGWLCWAKAKHEAAVLLQSTTSDRHTLLSTGTQTHQQEHPSNCSAHHKPHTGTATRLTCNLLLLNPTSYQHAKPTSMHIPSPVTLAASAPHHWDINHSTHPQIGQPRPLQVLLKPSTKHEVKLYYTPMYMG